MDEARGVFKDRSRWRSVMSAYPQGNRCEYIYVCRFNTLYALVLCAKIIILMSFLFLDSILRGCGGDVEITRSRCRCIL